MNKAREYLEGMVALVLMAYGIGLILGEVSRKMIFGKSKRYRLYSGLFVLLRLKVKVSYEDIPRGIAPLPVPSASALPCLNSRLKLGVLLDQRAGGGYSWLRFTGFLERRVNG